MIHILCGKSATGKDTLQAAMLKSGKYKPIVSYTTRPMREGEQEGREYHFVSKERFLELKEQDFFSEVRSYNTLVGGNPNTWYYGSPKVDPDAAEYVTILDIEGAEEYIRIYGPDKVNITILVVSEKERKLRAKLRGSFDIIEFDRRRHDDNIKFGTRAIKNLMRKTPNVQIKMNGDENYYINCYTKWGWVDHKVFASTYEEAKRIRNEWINHKLYPTDGRYYAEAYGLDETGDFYEYCDMGVA